MIHGKDFGPHAFIVALRNPRDHSFVPGVVCGDIGPKLGYNAVDNGAPGGGWMREGKGGRGGRRG